MVGASVSPSAASTLACRMMPSNFVMSPSTSIRKGCGSLVSFVKEARPTRSPIRSPSRLIGHISIVTPKGMSFVTSALSESREMRQLSFFDGDEQERERGRRLYSAVDGIRARFGNDSLRMGRVLSTDIVGSGEEDG